VLIPKEQLSARCHGTFNVKNIVFQYGTKKKPTAVLFTDFQNVHCASPAVDLPLFLSLNVSLELRVGSWAHLFSFYYRTLLKALSEFLDCPEEALLPKFSTEDFKEEFSRHVVCGYVITGGFITSSLSKGLRI
jgi:hypothetical protein